MSISRHQTRIMAMQSLYELDFRPDSDVNEVAKRNAKEISKEENPEYEFGLKLILGTLKNTIKIDAIIQAAAPEWPLDQIAVLDKIILRLATYELLFTKDVPPKVAIDEAVELAKSFGGENSSKFINGALGTIYRSSDIYKPEDDIKEEEAKK